ncbi:MAG TPA: DNA polymerase III subunit gamma/tau [Bacteroidetes bacterium]|nr:DNA polymerase III subunit gamma/tau [Bacteroidota bacterium]
MSYVVSARKYRPARFDEVVGQQHVSQTLKKALQTDHLAHAFLFCGPRGVGKTTCARILAKVLNCQNVTADAEPCGTCDSCKAFAGNASFNIMELDAASNNSVDHIRTLVEQVRFQPQQGKYKVFIIDEVHMLSQAAFNAFLKTLEEPPPYAIFILATTEKHKIIPTILSRCQIFDFKRIQIKDIVGHLEKICKEEGIAAEQEALHIIAQKADGALRDALSIFDRIVSFSGKNITYEDVIGSLNVLDYDYYFRFTDALLTSDLQQVLLIFDEITRNGFEGDLFNIGLAEHLRNLLVCKDKETLRLLEVSDSLKKRYHQQAAVAPSSFILTALNLANDCDINYKMARDKHLHVQMSLIKMCFSGIAVSQSAVISPQSAVATGATSGQPAVAEKKKADLNAPAEKVTDKAVIAEAPEVLEEKTNGAAAPAIEKRYPIPEEEALVEAAPLKVEEPPVEPMSKPDGSLGQKGGHPDYVEPKPTGRPSIRQSKNSNLPKLQSLDSLHAEVEEAEENKGNQIAKLTQADLEETWKAYIETSTKDSVKTMLKGAEISIKAEGEEVTVVVGSALAESTIRQERSLMDHLRKSLNAPMLAMKIKLDPSRSNAAPAKPKKLTDSEKYWRMKTINPLVDEVRKRFDLKLDT